MAHFAQLDENNIVTQVIVVNNDVVSNLPFPDSEAPGIAFCKSILGKNTVWRQTSYNRNFRKNYASSGYAYDVGRDAFVPPQPFPSWTLDEATCQWMPPIPYPTDDRYYEWNEASGDWVLA